MGVGSRVLPSGLPEALKLPRTHVKICDIKNFLDKIW